MNITVHTPTTDDRVVERRRCTHAGVRTLTIELADGTRLVIDDRGSGVFVATAPMPQTHLVVVPSAAYALYIGVMHAEDDEAEQ